MSILHALVERYDRLTLTGEVPILGCAPAQISFTVVLDGDGRIVTVEDERSGSGKRLRPKTIIAPATARTSGVVSGALWDKTSYVFGRSAAKDPARVAAEHAAWRERHKSLLVGVDDVGCAALLAFIRSWTPDRYESLPNAAEMADSNVAFRLDGDDGYLHDRPAARDALAAEATASDATVGICLIGGKAAPLSLVHPPIKGVPGAQSSGAAIVSFNQQSMTSYGWDQGANAPVSEVGAHAYTAALNALLASEGTDAKGRPIRRHRVMLGSAVTVFWTNHPETERLVAAMIAGADDDDDDALPVTEQTEAAKVREMLSAMQNGTPLQDAADLDPATKVYVLGLSPSAGRIAVRFWIEQSLDAFAGHYQAHWADMRIDPPPSKQPSVWRMLLELAPQRESSAIPSHLTGDLMRAILTGQQYPRSLLGQVLGRIRADHDINAVRVAMIRAYLARLRRLQTMEDLPVSLDLASTNTAYRLGRMFATLERLQAAAIGGLNATLGDKYYSAASARPATAFPTLISNARNHSKAVRLKTGPGLAEWFEDKLTEISAGLATFPRTLSLEDQGQFALGYYHQRNLLRRKKDVPPELEVAETTTNEE